MEETRKREISDSSSNFSYPLWKVGCATDTDHPRISKSNQLGEYVYIYATDALNVILKQVSDSMSTPKR